MKDLLESSVVEKEDFDDARLVKYRLFYNFTEFYICVEQKFKNKIRDFVEEDIEFIKLAHDAVSSKFKKLK